MIEKLIAIITSVGITYYLFFIRTKYEKNERYTEEVETYIKITGLFLIGFILTYLFGGKRKNEEGRFIPNLVIIRDTGVCSNSCYHIHHWIWGAALILFYIVLNFLFGYSETEYYKYGISLFFGSAISEYIRYGNDIFRIREFCYPTCKVTKNRR